MGGHENIINDERYGKMIQKLESLLKLQAAEIEIQRLDAVLDAVPEKLSALDARKASLQEAYEKETEAITSLKKRYREMDAELQANSERISKSQGKLPAVKTNKEYQALLKEIDDLKGKNSDIEDEMLACLEELENAEKDISERGALLKQTQNQINAEKETVELEADKDRQLLAAAREKVALLDKDVDAALKVDYNRVKKIIKTPAVVPVLKAVCQGCHMNIPPQMFNELQRGDQLKFCPHCGRIIFWNDLTD